MIKLLVPPLLLCFLLLKALAAPPYLDDTFEQWLMWEEQSNVVQFRKTTDVLPFNITSIPAEQAHLDAVADLPEFIKNLIVLPSGQIAFPKHVYNTDSYLVPWTDGPNLSTWNGRLTASRSVVILAPNGRRFSIKMPTDFIQEDVMQPKKANLKNSVIISRRRTDLIDTVTKQLGEVPFFHMQRELVSVTAKSNKNGYIIRDLSNFKPDHYYLPALSIPFEGKTIAATVTQDFDQLWAKAYAELLGKAKAVLLLRYGLQMYTPNAQNMLLELDQSLKPTGNIVFRDVSDTRFVEHVAKALGGSIKQAFKDEKAAKYTFDEFLYPYWENSSWRFDEAGVPSKTILDWGQEHDRAFASYILTELELEGEIDITNYRTSKEQLWATRGHSPLIKQIDKLLKSDKGKKALGNYHKRIKSKASSGLIKLKVKSKRPSKNGCLDSANLLVAS
ncbi:MAG: hypothetical protein ISR65_16825 [Bacteriovoracaceae bacterium]|nr:hypothetical protein [Bacteriovoracaceae bacterium]